MLIALVSSILKQLIAIAIENARRELKLVTDVKKEVEKLERNFKAILYWLEDAEQRQIVDHNGHALLVELKRVSDDMKKVLDEWSTALSQSQTDPELDWLGMVKREKWIGIHTLDYLQSGTDQGLSQLKFVFFGSQNFQASTQANPSLVRVIMHKD